MRRRQFIAGLASAVAWPQMASAQQAVRQIGMLMGLAESDPEGQQRLVAFRRGLETLGWSERNNIRIIARWAGANDGLTRTYASELITLRPDVIVVNTPIGLSALQTGTNTIPIVFAQVVDAAEGRISEIANPGGNITGFYIFFEYAMAGKWLEYLRDVVPRLKRVALLQSRQHPAWSGYFNSIYPLAKSLGIEVIPAQVRDPEEIEQAINKLAGDGGDGLIVLPDTFTTAYRNLIISLAARRRLPAIGQGQVFAKSGGLLSYGGNVVDLLRQTASYVDRILRGENPGSLPLQESTKFELVVNLKTARALGFTIPETMLVTADEVIE